VGLPDGLDVGVPALEVGPKRACAYFKATGQVEPDPAPGDATRCATLVRDGPRRSPRRRGHME